MLLLACVSFRRLNPIKTKSDLNYKYSFCPVSFTLSFSLSLSQHNKNPARKLIKCVYDGGSVCVGESVWQWDMCEWDGGSRFEMHSRQRKRQLHKQMEWKCAHFAMLAVKCLAGDLNKVLLKDCSYCAKINIYMHSQKIRFFIWIGCSLFCILFHRYRMREMRSDQRTMEMLRWNEENTSK